MGKRLKFKCWNKECGKTYTLFKKVENEVKLLVACPHCHKEGMVDLRKYKDKTISTHKGDSTGSEETLVLNLPEIIPTEEPEQDPS